MEALSSGTMLGNGEQVTPLIREIARGLGSPLAAFNWVLTRVEYAPYYGLIQGAHVTALELRGNDYDQCVLLVSLLKELGVPGAGINYVEGDITYTHGQIESWLHWDPAKTPAALVAQGIESAAVADTVKVRRVWVEATIQGVAYKLDPAFKQSARSPRVDVSTVYPQYSSAAITALANVNTHDGAGDQASVSPVSIDAFQAKLSEVTSAYVRKAAENYDEHDARSLLGIPVLAQAKVTELPQSIPGSVPIEAPWSEIPGERLAKLRIYLTDGSLYFDSAGDLITQNVLLECWSLGEDILSVRFGSGNLAVLYRNENAQGTEVNLGTLDDFVLAVRMIE